MAADDLCLRRVCLKEINNILEAGYTLPVTSIWMEGKPDLLRTLQLHHFLFRSKAELDQIKSGLTALGVLDAMFKYPIIFGAFFVAGKQPPLLAGSTFFSTGACDMLIQHYSVTCY